MTWRNRTNWDRLNPEELWRRLQDASRNLSAKLPEKLCASAPRAKAALNTKDACSHQMLLIDKILDKENLFMKLFLTASSFYSVFTQVSKTFNSTVALQGGFLKHLGDVTTVLLYLVCLSLFGFFMSFRQTDDDQIRSLCGALAAVRQNITGLLQLMVKWMFGNVNWYFLRTHYSKI